MKNEEKEGYIGIDYGLGQVNRDEETGIRFGVISQNEVLQSWSDSSEPDYGELEEGEALDDFAEPIGFTYDSDGYKAYAGDDGDIFILKSPYYTKCQFCSPCAPGAGYLMHFMDNGIKTYCFGHDWFEEGKAPYPVYSVETGKVILP